MAVSREVYRKFIEESGIKESITDILYRLWEESEKPSNLDSYVREYFGKQRSNSPNLEHLKEDIKAFEEVIEKLKKENKKMETILAIYEDGLKREEVKDELQDCAYFGRPKSSSGSESTLPDQHLNITLSADTKTI